MRRLSGVILFATVLMAGCAQDPLLGPHPAATVVIGSGATPAERMLAELIGGALARAGTPVRVEQTARDQGGLAAAMDEGAITLAPAFTSDPGAEPGAEARESEDVCKTISTRLPQGIAISDCAEAIWRTDGDGGPAQYAVARYRDGALVDAQLRRVNLVLGTVTPAELSALTQRLAQGQPIADVARAWLDKNTI